MSSDWFFLAQTKHSCWFTFCTWFTTGVVPKPTCQVPQAGAGSCSGRSRCQVRFWKEVRLQRWRQQRHQIHRPRQHRRTGPEPRAHLQLRRTEPHGRPGQYHRERTGGPSEDLRVHRHGSDRTQPRLGHRTGHHHLYPGLIGRAIRQRTVVFAKTERSQSYISKDQHVLMKLHSGRSKTEQRDRNKFPQPPETEKPETDLIKKQFKKKTTTRLFYFYALRRFLWSVDTVAAKNIHLDKSHRLRKTFFFS